MALKEEGIASVHGLCIMLTVFFDDKTAELFSNSYQDWICPFPEFLLFSVPNNKAYKFSQKSTFSKSSYFYRQKLNIYKMKLISIDQNKYTLIMCLSNIGDTDIFFYMFTQSFGLIICLIFWNGDSMKFLSFK
jgi:hypothetical protein